VEGNSYSLYFVRGYGITHISPQVAVLCFLLFLFGTLENDFC
jgi:hypothetical protein